MLGWLYRKLIGHFSTCEHTFEIHKETTVNGDYGSRFTRYALRCNKCGRMKIVNGE